MERRRLTCTWPAPTAQAAVAIEGWPFADEMSNALRSQQPNAWGWSVKRLAVCSYALVLYVRAYGDRGIRLVGRSVASGSTRAQLRAAAEAVKRLSERCPRGLGFRDMSYAKPHVEPLLDSVAPRIVQEFGDAACVLALVACDGSGDEQIGMRYCAFALVTAAHIEALLDARVTDIRACYAGVAEAVLAVTSDP